MKKLSTYLVLLVFLMTVAFSYPTASADTKFKVTSTVTSNSAMLKWNKLSGAKYYQVYRKTAKTKYKVVCKKTTNKSFTSKNLKSGIKYTFKVTAFEKNAKGKFYGFKSATITATPKFKLTTSATQNQATLKWNKADGAKYYKVYRKIAGTNYKLVCKKTTSRTFVSKNLKENTKYTFKVKAYKKNKKGNYYAFKSVTGSVKTKALTPTTTTTIPTTVTTETTTVPPTPSPGPLTALVLEKRKIFNSFTNYEKLKLFERDVKYALPTTAEVVEFEVEQTGWVPEGAWGYVAKVKIDLATSQELVSLFENYYAYLGYFDGRKDIYSWWGPNTETLLTGVQRARTGIFKGLSYEGDGKDLIFSYIHTSSYLTKSNDGEYYVYIAVDVSIDCEEYYASIYDNTLPPLSTANGSLSTYIKNLTARQKAMLVNKDFKYSLPESAKLLEFNLYEYATDKEYDKLNDAWYYTAKYKLSQEDGIKAKDKFLADSYAFTPEIIQGYLGNKVIDFNGVKLDANDVVAAYHNLGSTNLVYDNGQTVSILGTWNFSWLFEKDGEYYLYLTTQLPYITSEWYEYKNTDSQE